MVKKNAFRMSNRLYERLKHEIDAREEQFTPLPENLCRDCNGEVVKNVAGLFRGNFQYFSPVCQGCGRPYPHATNVRTVGEQEFLDLVRKPFTV